MDYIHTRFAKLSVIYAEEIRNYREDNSRRSFARLHMASLSWPGMDAWHDGQVNMCFPNSINKKSKLLSAISGYFHHCFDI